MAPWQTFSLSDGHGDGLDESDACLLKRKLLAEVVLSAGTPMGVPPSLGDSAATLISCKRRNAPATSTFSNAATFAEALDEQFSCESSSIIGSRDMLPSGPCRSFVCTCSKLGLSWGTLLAAAASTVSFSKVIFVMLARLPDLLVNELVMLATLNLRIIDDAEALTL